MYDTLFLFPCNGLYALMEKQHLEDVITMIMITTGDTYAILEGM